MYEGAFGNLMGSSGIRAESFGNMEGGVGVGIGWDNLELRRDRLGIWWDRLESGVGLFGNLVGSSFGHRVESFGNLIWWGLFLEIGGDRLEI